MSWSYEALPELTERQCQRWEQILEERTGIHFADHKSILRTGLRRRMQAVGCSDFDEYYARVVSDDTYLEWSELICSLTVRETSFFRDPDAHQLVREHLQQRLSGKDPVAMIHLWSVGCSSGEEAYSLAMSAHQALSYANVTDTTLSVTGTDISKTALADAKEAVFEEKALDKVGQLERNRWFRKDAESGRYRVTDDLKAMMKWVAWNITELEGVPVSKADIIFCQNVLIYFRPEVRKRILDKLVSHLNVSGVLVVGSGEVTDWHNAKVERIKSDSVQAYRLVV